MFSLRKSVKGWKGPASVLGQDGKFVLIRHGSSFHRCHPSHLMKVKQHITNTTTDTNENCPSRKVRSVNFDKKVNLRVFYPNQKSSTLVESLESDDDEDENLSIELNDSDGSVNETDDDVGSATSSNYHEESDVVDIESGDNAESGEDDDIQSDSGSAVLESDGATPSSTSNDAQGNCNESV